MAPKLGGVALAVGSERSSPHAMLRRLGNTASGERLTAEDGETDSRLVVLDRLNQ